MSLSLRKQLCTVQLASPSDINIVLVYIQTPDDPEHRLWELQLPGNLLDRQTRSYQKTEAS